MNFPQRLYRYFKAQKNKEKNKIHEFFKLVQQRNEISVSTESYIFTVPANSSVKGTLLPYATYGIY